MSIKEPENMDNKPTGSDEDEVKVENQETPEVKAEDNNEAKPEDNKTPEVKAEDNNEAKPENKETPEVKSEENKNSEANADKKDDKADKNGKSSKKDSASSDNATPQKKKREKKPSEAQKYERKENETKYEAKQRVRKEYELKQKRNKKAAKVTTGVVIAAVAAAIVGVNVSNYMSSIDYFRINDEKISENEYKFYFNSTYNQYASMYSSYMGLDTSQSLDSQQYDDDYTYQDIFDQQAVNSIIYYHALLDDAEENDFEYDTAEELQTTEDSLASYAEENSTDEDSYYKQLYGISKSDAEQYIEDGIVAQAYYKELGEQLQPTEDEIDTEYTDNKDSYDKVEYLQVTVSADIPDDIDTTSDDLTDEQQETVDAAYQKAVESANKIAAAKSEDEFKMLAVDAGAADSADDIEETSMTGNTSSSDSGEWMFDASREKGDTTTVESSDSNSVDVYYFISREKPTDITKNFQMYTVSASYDEDADEDAISEACDTAKSDAEAILTAYEDTDKTEDDFNAVKYNDSGATEYENAEESSLNEKVAEWVFSEDRAEGDTAVIEDGETYYVVYFSGDGEESWHASVKSSLASTKLSDYIDELQDKYEVSDPKGHLNYLKVKEALEETSTSSSSSDSSSSSSGDTEEVTTSSSEE